MRLLIVTIVLALSAIQAMANHSYEVLSSEIRYRFNELSQTTDYKSLILDPIGKALFKEEPEEIYNELYEKTREELVDFIGELLEKDGGNRKAEYERRFLNPCVELLARLGRPIEKFIIATMDHQEQRILSELPIAVHGVCRYLIDAEVANFFL